jgi:hypothetical protein
LDFLISGQAGRLPPPASPGAFFNLFPSEKGFPHRPLAQKKPICKAQNSRYQHMNAVFFLAIHSL